MLESMNSNKKTKASELHSEITAEVIRLMETAGTDWVKSWSALGIHSQAVSLTDYKGGNQFWLSLVAARHGWHSPFWATYKTWAAAGSQVRKGETGTKLIRWVDAKCKEHGTAKCEVCGPFLLPVTFTVFNAAQCDHDGWEPPFRAEPNEDERVDNCDLFLRKSGAVIFHGGDSAYYDPSQDQIVLPQFENFDSAVAYYGTAFHELIHWTGAAKRTDRHNKRGKGSFGSEEYAYEELVAELGACFLAAEFGIEPVVREDHAKYLNNWIKALKGDEKLIWTAAQDASKAITWLRAKIDKKAGVGA
jgi:antirestriction protein ArdC